MQRKSATLKAQSTKALTPLEEALLAVADANGEWVATRTSLLKMVATAALKQTNGNQCEAARRLGMHRNTLSRVMGGV